MAKATTAEPKTTRRVRSAMKPGARRRAAAPVVTHEDIARRAYEIHLAGGEGDAMAHWLRAEHELVRA